MTTQTHFKNMYIRSININMEDICTGCLCAGRKLHSISETGLFQVYSQILNEIPVENMSQINIQICWECCALLQKFQHFKAQVKRNYTELLWNVPTPIASHLTSSTVHNLSYPEHNTPEVKTEFQPFTVKIEEADGNGEWRTLDGTVMVDEHQEPETFVNDFAVALEEKPSKKSKKKPKTKKPSKNKIKVKKKKLKPSPEVKSDTDTPQDDFIDADDGEEIEKESEIEKKEEIAVKKDEKKTEVQNGIKSVKVSNALTGQLLPDRPVCVECGKVFSSKKTYRYHLNVLHKGNNHYPCPRCGKIYQWKSNLGRHMRTHKAVDTGELYCELCDKSFASVATYRQHLRISRRHVSENEFNFTCNECGKKFVNKTRLRDHIDWEHLKKIKFRCQLCNKPFKCHTSLYVHLQNVHTNKEKKDNLCHVCGKSYQNAAKLKYHIIATHTGETPYRCAQCAAAFGWYSSLYRHVREVHYKVKSQPKKTKKPKKIDEPPNYISYHQ